ncbi:adenosylcobinamide-GDP ribazoletransferase [Solirubrobacter soli]|uniref:adenosylcobinamide-GDP ribazoletransferase n=1 Tax=Solirubrobacter soli TaxID=363832 RepID=UPI0004195A7E|nr:adenosylcobinamide-GDP ribazoletransferase [Solirubrobacter soli]
MLTAVAFLTRIPVRGGSDLTRAALFFPLVGALVGGIAAGTRALADQALPPLPATLLAVTAAMIVSGALHEDGLADVADALGAHTTRERRLEILKDPRVGTFGALALIVAIGISTTTIATLDTADAVKALIIAHTLSRWAILPVSKLPPAKPGGSGSLLRVTTPGLIAATVLAAVIVTPLGGAPALLAAAIAAAVTGFVLHHTLGGITGDGYGATAKVAELAAGTTVVALTGGTA